MLVFASTPIPAAQRLFQLSHAPRVPGTPKGHSGHRPCRAHLSSKPAAGRIGHPANVTSQPAGASHAWQALGCKIRPRHPPTRVASTLFAAVRCCSDSRSPWPCITICNPAIGGNFRFTSPVLCNTIQGEETGLLTWSEAARECAMHSRRVCSHAELERGKCCRTGCGKDAEMVWAEGTAGPNRSLTMHRRGELGERRRTQHSGVGSATCVNSHPSLQPWEHWPMRVTRQAPTPHF